MREGMAEIFDCDGAGILRGSSPPWRCGESGPQPRDLMPNLAGSVHEELALAQAPGGRVPYRPLPLV